MNGVINFKSRNVFDYSKHTISKALISRLKKMMLKG